MSTEPESSARQRFARDLRRIREEREVSLAAIHEATRVPVSHLQTFEEGALYDHPRMNPVYLRAFIRGYAEAVGISPDFVVEHLEAALDGEYQNQLVVQYLDVPPSVADESLPSDSVDPRSSDKPSDAAIEDEDDEPDVAAPSGTSASEEEGTSPEPTRKDSGSEEGSVHEENGGVGASRASRKGKEGRLADDRGGSFTEDASSRSQKGAFSQAIQGFRRERLSTGGLVVTALFVLVLTGGILAYFGVSDSSSDPSSRADRAVPEHPPDTSVSSDPLPTNTSRRNASQRQPPLANLTLGDTLYVTVLATSDVREMRVQQDDDLRRPYWIEEGNARVFPFTRRITLENELDRLQLFLEQYPYPSSRTDDEGRVVIRRDTVQQFADTLRGAPASLPARPDTVQINKPPSIDSGSLSSFSQR